MNPFNLLKMQQTPGEESFLRNPSRGRGLSRKSASDARPCPQIARKLANLNYNKCLDSVDVKSFPESVPCHSVYRCSLSSGADELLTRLGFLIQKLWKQGLSVVGGGAVFHLVDTMQFPCLFTPLHAAYPRR